MDPSPRTEAIEIALGRAVSENLYSLFRAMALNLPGGALQERSGLSRHRSFPMNPMFKGAWNTHLRDDEIDDAIAETIQWFRQGGEPFFFWWVDLETEPVDLPDRLLANGFSPNVTGDPGMAVELAALPERFPVPEGFSIVQARDRRALEDWRDVFCAAYELPPFAGQAWVDAALAGSVPWQLYVGYWNGEPVATNILYSGGEAASVYGVGVLPGARGHGIGAEITAAPLREARAQGYQHGVLYATEMGYPIYQRMGFRRVPALISRYLWVKPNGFGR